MPHARQPVGFPQIDRAHPLALGLIDAAFPYLHRTAEGDQSTNTSTVTPGIGPGGRMVGTTETTARLAFSGGWSKRGAPLTLVVVYRLRNTPVGGVRVAGNWSNSAYGYELIPNASNFRALVSRSGVNTTLTGDAVNQLLQVDALTIDGTNASYYQRGRLVAGPTAHGGVTAATGNFSFGASNDADTAANAEYYCALLYGRVLSPGEIQNLSGNPWQIFKSNLVAFQASAGGVSGTVNYTNANDTSSASGTTTVVGTSSTTNANDTSSASGTTTVTGTVNYTNANDTSAASGTAGATTGTVDYTNANDTATASGWAGTVSGTVDYTNNDDTSTAQGQVVGVESDRASGGFAWLEYISDREREEYRKKRREVYQNAPKKVTAVVKKVAQKAAIEQREPEPEEIEQAFQSEGVAYQPDYGQMAQNAYRLYLQLLINRRKLEQEAEKEREQTRQFIVEQTRIASEDQQRRAQLIEEEAVFMTVAALLLD